MPYCPRCGVEADPSVRSCPLCSTAIPEFADLGAGEPAWPAGSRYNPAKTYSTSTQRRRRAFFVVAAILGTAALVVAVIDGALSGSVTWSRWPLIDFAAVLALTAAVLAWPRRPVLWGTAAALLTAAFLAATDAAGGGGWFLPLGLPIAGAAFALLLAGVLLLRRRRLGFNLFAVVPALAGVLLTVIDAAVNAWLGAGPLGWSLITSLVLFPLALLFTLLHFALPRTPDLRRIFHF